MSTLKRVDQLTSAHVGKIIRVQGYNGGYIEGTLAMIKHVTVEPYDSEVSTHVAFEEFANAVDGGIKYLMFRTCGECVAMEVAA